MIVFLNIENIILIRVPSTQKGCDEPTPKISLDVDSLMTYCKTPKMLCYKNTGDQGNGATKTF